MGYKVYTNTVNVEEELLNKLSILGLEIALPKDDDEEESDNNEEKTDNE